MHIELKHTRIPNHVFIKSLCKWAIWNHRPFLSIFIGTVILWVWWNDGNWYALNAQIANRQNLVRFFFCMLILAFCSFGLLWKTPISSSVLGNREKKKKNAEHRQKHHTYQQINKKKYANKAHVKSINRRVKKLTHWTCRKWVDFLCAETCGMARTNILSFTIKQWQRLPF